MTDPEVLEVSVHVAADPETVFPYFTDPARYVQWMGAEAVLEPVVGGTYRVMMGNGAEACGEFVEVDPPHRIEFTWGWIHDPEVPPGSSRVVVTLQRENGGTRLILRHYDLPDATQQAHHREGWSVYMSRLGTCLRGDDPGPDPNVVTPEV